MARQPGLWRNIQLWAHTRTRFEKGVVLCGLLIVVWALYVIASAPTTLSPTAQASLSPSTCWCILVSCSTSCLLC